MAGVRHFGTGATRDQDTSKNDYEGFLSPLVIEAYGDYMNTNRVQPDGSVRASDNWQLGIPKDAYMKSLLRHVLDVWKWHRGYAIREHMIGGVKRVPTRDELFAAVLFNVMGYWHELLKADQRIELEKHRIIDEDDLPF